VQPSIIEGAVGQQNLAHQRLPFTVQPAIDGADLLRCAVLRQAAYGRHVPNFALTLAQPESADGRPDAVVLLARAKFDGAAVGTLRIQTNIVEPLPLERTVTLPEIYQGKRLAEAVRLAVPNGNEGLLPRDVLFKAFYLACVDMRIDWMVICARHPLHKLYLGLHFHDVFANGEFIPMPHIGDIPHRVLALRVSDVERLWREPRHRLYQLFFEMAHDDIKLNLSRHPITLADYPTGTVVA